MSTLEPKRILILKRTRSPPSVDPVATRHHLILRRMTAPKDVVNSESTNRQLVLVRAPIQLAPEEASTCAPASTRDFSNPLNLYRGLVADKIPKEGRRKWGFQAVQDSTQRVAKEIVLLGQPTAGAQLSLYRAFCRWRAAHVNERTSIGQTLCIFAGYLIESQLKASTSAVYVRQLEVLCKREPPSGIPPEWSVVNDCIKGLELMATKQPRDHAIDISQERAIEIINTIKDQGVAFSIWSMCMCGARAADLIELHEGSFVVLENYVHVHFHKTKSRRRQDEQYSVDLPIWYPLPAHLSAWSKKPSPFMSLTSRGAFECDANRIDRILHSAGFPETTYSFRRLFMNGIIDRLTENGVTKWLEVIELSGHETPKVAKSLYKDHTVARLPTGNKKITNSESKRALTLRRT